MRTVGPVKKVGIITPKVSPFGWAVWCAVSGGLATFTSFIVPSALSEGGSRYALPILVTGLAVQVAVAYIVILGAARASFTRGSFVSSARWALGREPLTKLASSEIIGVGLLAMIVMGGYDMNLIAFNIYLMLMTVLTVSRGLQHVYKEQYLDFVNPEIKLKSDAAIKDRIVRLVKPQPWQLIAPLIQSLLIIVLPSQLLLALFSTALNWNYTVVTLIIASALPACAVVWAKWHRAGGLLRITRIGRGRPMGAQS